MRAASLRRRAAASVGVGYDEMVAVFREIH
jgi:hypothetical protein